MVALIKAYWWDEDKDENRVDYLGVSNCDTFVQAGEYLEGLYGGACDKAEIEFLDTELYLSEEIFDAIRKDKNENRYR